MITRLNPRPISANTYMKEVPVFPFTDHASQAAGQDLRWKDVKCTHTWCSFPTRIPGQPRDRRLPRVRLAAPSASGTPRVGGTPLSRRRSESSGILIGFHIWCVFRGFAVSSNKIPEQGRGGKGRWGEGWKRNPSGGYSTLWVIRVTCAKIADVETARHSSRPSH